MWTLVAALAMWGIGVWAGWTLHGWWAEDSVKHGFEKPMSPENVLWWGLLEALRMKFASQSQILSEVKRLKQMEVQLEEWLEQMEGTGRFGEVGFRVCEDSTEQAHLVAHVVREVVKVESR